MAAITEYFFYPEATPGVVKDVYLKGGTPDCLKGDLKLILLRITPLVRQYGKHKKASGLDMFTFVAMDGSFGVLKLVLSVSLCRDIPHEHMDPGCTLTVKSGEYRVLTKKRMMTEQ